MHEKGCQISEYEIFLVPSNHHALLRYIAAGTAAKLDMLGDTGCKQVQL
jgi:hypothetical protein